MIPINDSWCEYWILTPIYYIGGSDGGSRLAGYHFDLNHQSLGQHAIHCVEQPERENLYQLPKVPWKKNIPFRTRKIRGYKNPHNFRLNTRNIPKSLIAAGLGGYSRARVLVQSESSRVILRSDLYHLGKTVHIPVHGDAVNALSCGSQVDVAGAGIYEYIPGRICASSLS